MDKPYFPENKYVGMIFYNPNTKKTYQYAYPYSPEERFPTIPKWIDITDEDKLFSILFCYLSIFPVHL